MDVGECSDQRLDPQPCWIRQHRGLKEFLRNLRQEPRSHVMAHFHLPTACIQERKQTLYFRCRSLILFLLVSSADGLCKQFGPRPGPTFCRA